MERFDADSFGANCPDNWEEILDYLNEKITIGDKEELELIWERYCASDYEDVPNCEV